MGGATVDILARLKLAGGQFSRDFKTQMDGVEREARSSASRINATWRGVSSGIGTLAAGVGVAGLALAAKRGLDYASSLGEVSQQLGVTTKDLQVYRYAATQVGIEQEAMDKSLAKLTRTIGEAATGGKQQQRVFKALGIDIRDAGGHIKTAGELIPEVAAALEGVHNPAQRAAVLVQLFGKTGQQLETLLAGGRGQVDGLSDAAKRLGIVLSDKQIQSADETADKLAAMKQVLEANIARAVSDNAQAILGLANSFASLTTNIANFWTKNPEQAMTLMGLAGGAMVGARFGPYGAVIGGMGGAIAGSAMAPDTPVQVKIEKERKRIADSQAELARVRRPGWQLSAGGLNEGRSIAILEGRIKLAQREIARLEARLPKPAPAQRQAASASGEGGGSLDLGNLSGGGGGTRTRATISDEIQARVRADLNSTAARYTGMHEGQDRGALQALFREANMNVDPAIVKWCAAFVNAVLATNGLPGTGKLNARSFLDYGQKTDDPKAGDIVVLRRGKNPDEGHVGFFQGFDAKGNVRVLGGNQSHAVNTQTFSRRDVLGFRSAPDPSEAYAQEQKLLDQQLERQAEILKTIREKTAAEVEGIQFAGLRAQGLDREADLQEQLLELEREAAAQLANLPAEQSKVTDGLQAQLSLAGQQAEAFASLLQVQGDRQSLTAAERQAEADKLAALRAALDAARDMAKTGRDQIEIDKAIVGWKHKIANAADDGAAAAARQKKEDEEAQQRYLQMMEERHDAQERQFQELADFWEQAFRSGGKSVWEDFKDQGYHVLGQLAAQWTMQLLSGQKISLPGALEQLGAVSGAGRGGFDILSLFGMGGGGGMSGAAGRVPGGGFGGGNPATRMAELEKVVGGLQDPGTAAGGIGGAMGSIGQAVPYVAAAMAATSMISDVLGIKNHAGGMFGILGNLAINAATPAKRGSATLGFDQYGQLGVSSSRGNSSKRVDAAKDAIGSASDTLERIAEALGGSLTGSVTASIGLRDGNWRVDPTGRGITKTKNGAIDFGKDAEAAARYLVGEALRDGVVAGISDASKRILASGQELERAIEKAALIESIPERLAAYLDPMGAQLDELQKRWEKTIAALREGGASAEEMAKAQQLYKLELQETKAAARDASADLKDFLQSIAFGSASPYSLRDQEQKAFEALKPFLDQIDGKERIDQGQYTAAASAYLEIERALGGSTSAFFDKLSMVQDYTNRAIADIDNAKPIRTYADPFAEKTASNTLASSEILADIRDRTANTEALLGRILGAVSGGGGDWVGSGNGFVRSLAGDIR